jgi:hypothetical protein
MTHPENNDELQPDYSWENGHEILGILEPKDSTAGTATDD